MTRRKYGNLYEYQCKLVKDGKCYVCDGKETTPIIDQDGNWLRERAICHHCEGSGKPTENDLERLKLYEARICVICELPMVGDSPPETKYTLSSDNDCIGHAIQRIKVLENVMKEVGIIPSVPRRSDNED